MANVEKHNTIVNYVCIQQNTYTRSFDYGCLAGASVTFMALTANVD
jgi:hypothetical protein